MKKLFIAFIFICMYFPFPSMGQSEVTINLNNMIVNFSDYMQQANWFKDRYYGLDNFKLLQRERVNYNDITTIKEAMNGNHAEQYVRGCRIYYGLTLQNKIALYFVPLYANLAFQDGDNYTFEISEPSGGFDGVLSNSAYDIYYVYEGQLFDLRDDGVELEEAPDNIARYRFNVTPKPGYAMDQVYSVFIPFQEIDTLYQHNRSTVYNTGSIFFNSAVKFANGKHSHHLIMTTIRDYEQPYQSNTTFHGMAADMANLCPPQCQRVTYRVVR